MNAITTTTTFEWTILTKQQKIYEGRINLFSDLLSKNKTLSRTTWNIKWQFILQFLSKSDQNNKFLFFFSGVIVCCIYFAWAGILKTNGKAIKMSVLSELIRTRNVNIYLKKSSLSSYFPTPIELVEFKSIERLCMKNFLS